MNANFCRTLALLRQERGISQRKAAGELGISQALLSHYENGVREPGLEFVVKACDFYHVSADFLLGRSMSRDGTTILDADTLYDASEERDAAVKGSVMATLSKKLLVNSISVLFDLLSRTNCRDAIRAANSYLSTAVYKMFRYLYRAPGKFSEDVFPVTSRQFLCGAPTADMLNTETDYVDALALHMREGSGFPDMTLNALSERYPGSAQSLLQIVHTTGERISQNINVRKKD